MGQRNMRYCTNFSGHFYLWGQLQCSLNLLKLVPVKISSLKVFMKIKMQITHSKQPFVKFGLTKIAARTGYLYGNGI